MFKLVAMIFIVTNGVPADQPSSVIPNKRVFTSYETCMEFLAADAGKESMERFNKKVDMDKVVVRFVCAEIEEKPSSDDGKIL
jgi:hypothetical protein